MRAIMSGARDRSSNSLDADATIGGCPLEGTPGELLSLLPARGAAEGVRTEGLVYPLRGETLEAGSTRGVSNVFAEPTARVTIERGVLLAIKPGGQA
jgi:thiamine pyrophosphokinase